jgi:isoleucyl-tRNA synthetase
MVKAKSNQASSRAKKGRARKPAKANTAAKAVKRAKTPKTRAKTAKLKTAKLKTKPAAARAKSRKPAAPKAKTTTKTKTRAPKAKSAKTTTIETTRAKPRKSAPKTPATARVTAKATKAATKAKAKTTRKAAPKAKPATKPKSTAKSAPKPKLAQTPRPAPKPPQTGRDWSATLFLPKTEFPMKAGLPQREPELLKRWNGMRLYDRLREEAMGREKFILHDGPPYANGHLHIGHALNKMLKDVINRSQGMMGKDANYVPGWDCHGLPIEWKIEEENYRAKGKTKPDLSDPEAMIAFRRECRAYAQAWLNVQREEFERLGVEGDWQHPYTTMSFDAEATIAHELMKFAMNGMLYRGSKPVMWSVVEQTALAEAEVEYQEVTSHTTFVKFPIEPPLGPLSVTVHGEEGEERPTPEEVEAFNHKVAGLAGASVVIWTTTPWTIPGNRAIAFSPDIAYGLYEVVDAPADNWAKPGDKLVLADALAENVRNAARIESWRRITDVDPRGLIASHPLRKHPEAKGDYAFPVPVLPGDFVTEDTGTGFVHIAPGHGQDDFELGTKFGIKVPFTVDADGRYIDTVGIFAGRRVIDDKGAEGDANAAVIAALQEVGALVARGRLRHDYPHSWRSKKPVIFRNTPQWFIAMDEGIGDASDTLRERALQAIGDTRWVPPQGENRIRGMILTKPDWVVSRQRAWGVPITVFHNKETGAVIPSREFNASGELIDRIVEVFATEGADAWFEAGAKERFLSGLVDNPDAWEKVDDILDVWFDSGCTHAFVLEQRPDLAWPASLYLEGSDQHRGWFQSSLLEACGTRGRAPYDAVLTHGFVVDEDGRKMSKSLGNVVAPQDVIRQSGAEILRLWAMSSDYAEDLRIGPDIIKANVESYRKLRNTLRFLLGNLAHYRPSLAVAHAEMPELERYLLARLAELEVTVRAGYDDFDFKRVFHALFNFCVNDLSAFYFDIRKDALYCDPYGSVMRKSALTVLDRVFEALTAWLAPMLCFTMEEAWLTRFPGDKGSVHLRRFPEIPAAWRDEALLEKWRKVRAVRRVVTGALEIERKEGRIGSSLEAAPNVYIADDALRAAISGLDLAEIAITSGASVLSGKGPEGAFRLDEVPGVAVVFARAKGTKCARSWKILDHVGADPEFPELSPRDAEAVRQFDALKIAAE